MPTTPTEQENCSTCLYKKLCKYKEPYIDIKQKFDEAIEDYKSNHGDTYDFVKFTAACEYFKFAYKV